MSAVDRWLADVGTAALVGTARREPPDVPGLLGVRPVDQPAEHRLLASAAVVDALTRGGAALPPVAEPLAAAADEVRPPVSDRAAQLLTLLLTQPPVSRGSRDELVADWLQLADEAGQRVPWALLPALLDLAVGRRRVVRALGGALGERGAWLASLNEAWAGVLADGDEQATPVPDTEAARLLLEAHWTSASAKVRADALRALGPGLSLADEPLLERALDDRAKTVREAAVAMLDRLPGSARAARMAHRLRRLVQVKGLLVRHLEVEVPDPPDAAALRDGLSPPGAGVTPTVWLAQLVRAAPLTTWTDATGRDAAATLAMVRDADVLAWLTDAVVARRDQDWAVACVDHGIGDQRLFWLLPPERRARLLAEWVTRPAGRDLRSLLAEAPRPWPDDLGRAVLHRLRGAKADRALGHAAAPLLPVALSASLAPEVEAALADLPDDSDHLRRALTETLQLHAFRTSLTEAFR